MVSNPISDMKHFMDSVYGDVLFYRANQDTINKLSIDAISTKSTDIKMDIYPGTGMAEVFYKNKPILLDATTPSGDVAYDSNVGG